jgi:hypothetical protein
MLDEFHSRKRLEMKAKLLFIPLKTHVVTDDDDPFDLIDHAVLEGRQQDPGRRAATPPARRRRELSRRLRVSHRGSRLEPGTVAFESDDVKQIGAWDYDQLDHAERREVRGVFVLAAWLDQCNMRWENTRLAYVKRSGEWELQHLFSDVGSGLGLAQNMMKGRNSDVEAMLWEVTEQKDAQVRFSGFAPNVDNDAFEHLTWSDARWMLRRMAAFSEAQILDGLLATGMSAAELRLALEKLLSKRKKMVAGFRPGCGVPGARRPQHRPAARLRPPRSVRSSRG